jgi:hypothetical protein
MHVNANKMNNTFHPNQVKLSLLTFVTFQFVKLQCERPPSSKGQRTSNLPPIWCDMDLNIIYIHTWVGIIKGSSNPFFGWIVKSLFHPHQEWNGKVNKIGYRFMKLDITSQDLKDLILTRFYLTGSIKHKSGTS